TVARAGTDSSAAVQGRALMQDVLLRSQLDDKSFFGDILSSLGGAGGAGLRVALAVPITGKYAEIGQKIARGAGAAQWQLAASGLDLEIRVVNTDADGWVGRLAALPGEWSVVGGPLTVEGFKAMADAGVLKRRAVFSFLPGLGEFAEGRDAWRFFSSREDEVRALLDLCIHRLGITRFGVLAPEEDFGSRMRDIFTRLAMQEGGSITGSATYPPGEHTEWARRVARVLGVPAAIDKHALTPEPRFGAVFLPDGWNQAQLLVPNFFYYDAADMVYLGPNLWSRSLDQVGEAERNYFRLAVCPGAWWPETSGAEALQAELDAQGLGAADYWVALGYDFTRMASVLGPLPGAPAADEVNHRLARVASMTFSMAPVSYTADGVAMQRQYLFAPGSDGKRLADPEELRRGVEHARNLRQNRQEQMKKTRP
ncbi:MAG: ABC transporter substrate-binding protein, partial [Desulfovibrionaceae bacterium]